MARDEESSGSEPGELEGVRGELRRLGYLDHRVERYLLQDALRPERPLPTLLHLALKVGVLAGVPVALVTTLALAMAGGHLETSPLDVVPLFLHLLVPSLLGVGVAFLAVAGVLALLLRLTHVRRIEAMSFAMSVLAVGAVAVAAGWSFRRELAAAPGWSLAILGVALPLLAWAAVGVVHGGLLTLAVRLTHAPPERRPTRYLWSALGLAVAVLVVMLPALLEVRRGRREAPPSFPMTPGERVALLGVDGVLPQEVDYLLAKGELPRLAALAAESGGLLSYRRSAEPPATFWTTVATGVGAAGHGIESVDAFLPLGLERPLGRSGWLRPYWAWVAVPLGLAEHRPILAQSRRAHAVWELAARGGGPVVVVDWWSTFPAQPLPGLVVAHGAYQLLARSGAELQRDAVAPAAQISQVAMARRQALVATPVLPPGSRYEAAREAATRPDLFYRDLFRSALASAPRLAALYLPALDILREGDLGAPALADVLRWQLGAVDELLGELTDAGVGTIALVLDPGRTGGDDGLVLLWRRGGCTAAALHAAAPREERPILPGAVASALLRALGLPQSRGLPPPPAGCDWPRPSLVLDSYGVRQPVEATVTGDEYLESLRSLGYL